MATSMNYLVFTCRMYLEHKSVTLRGIEVDWKGWNYYAQQNLPQQQNGHDCGIFMLEVRIILLCVL